MIGRCSNCDAGLTGPYCASCGQKTQHSDLTLREFLDETTHELTHWEGRVAKTLKAVLLTPGLLTLDYLAGRRARWLPPQARAQIDSTWLGRMLGHERVERAVVNSAQLNHEMGVAYPRAMFVPLPVFAFPTSLAWRRSALRYPAHLYVALHLHAAWFGALTIAEAATLAGSGTGDMIAGASVVVYMLWYAPVALRRIFGGGWGVTIAKLAGVGAVYFFCYLIVSFGLMLYALSTM